MAESTTVFGFPPARRRSLPDGVLDAACRSWDPHALTRAYAARSSSPPPRQPRRHGFLAFARFAGDDVAVPARRRSLPPGVLDAACRSRDPHALTRAYAARSSSPPPPRRPHDFLTLALRGADDDGAVPARSSQRTADELRRHLRGHNLSGKKDALVGRAASGAAELEDEDPAAFAQEESDDDDDDEVRTFVLQRPAAVADKAHTIEPGTLVKARMGDYRSACRELDDAEDDAAVDAGAVKVTVRTIHQTFVAKVSVSDLRMQPRSAAPTLEDDEGMGAGYSGPSPAPPRPSRRERTMNSREVHAAKRAEKLVAAGQRPENLAPRFAVKDRVMVLGLRNEKHLATITAVRRGEPHAIAVKQRSPMRLVRTAEYDVKYDDGDYDTSVKEESIMALPAEEASTRRRPHKRGRDDDDDAEERAGSERLRARREEEARGPPPARYEGLGAVDEDDDDESFEQEEDDDDDDDDDLLTDDGRGERTDLWRLRSGVRNISAEHIAATCELVKCQACPDMKMTSKDDLKRYINEPLMVLRYRPGADIDRDLGFTRSLFGAALATLSYDQARHRTLAVLACFIFDEKLTWYDAVFGSSTRLTHLEHTWEECEDHEGFYVDIWLRGRCELRGVERNIAIDDIELLVNEGFL